MSRIVVLGGAESGVGAAVLAKVKGFDVFLSDNGKLKDDYKALLGNWQIAYEEGGHTYRETARHFNISTNTVGRFLKE